MRDKIRAQLLQLAEPDYKAFQEKLLPGVTDLLGVRVRSEERRVGKECRL